EPAVAVSASNCEGYERGREVILVTWRITKVLAEIFRSTIDGADAVDHEMRVNRSAAASGPLAPQHDAAEKTGFIRDNLDVLAWLEFDLFGVASADIQM